MDVSAKELRFQSGKIIEQVSRGVEVVITYRGKQMARIVPIDSKPENPEINTDEIHGLWKDRSDKSIVEEYIRKIRKGRSF
jgi:prevent-host-death family protein